MGRKLLVALMFLSVAPVYGWGWSAEAGTAGKVQVFVSILPQAYFVERIGGPNVHVTVMVAPGQDVHTYEPMPRIMAELARAQVYFRVGMPFEEVILKKVGSAFKNLRIVDTAKGIALRAFKEDEEDHHAEEAGHEHGKGKHSPAEPSPARDAAHEEGVHHGEAGDIDPHIWLDPKLVKIQAATIAQTLSEIDPAHAEIYEGNLKAFRSELDRLDADLAKALAPFKGKAFYVYHPAYGYFADAYGLKQIAVETGGKQPSAHQLAGLIKQAKARGVRIIFVQPQFSTKSAEALAKAIGGVVVPMDDLAKDYMKNMREMAEKVRKAMADGPR